MYDGFRSHWHTLKSSFVRFPKHATKKIIVQIIFGPKNLRPKNFDQGNRREVLSSGIGIWAEINPRQKIGTEGCD